MLSLIKAVSQYALCKAHTYEMIVLLLRLQQRTYDKWRNKMYKNNMMIRYDDWFEFEKKDCTWLEAKTIVEQLIEKFGDYKWTITNMDDGFVMFDYKKGRL